MKQSKLVLFYGFAIFVMFFGSGNLVFPLQIGQTSENYWLFGFLGLFLTGIMLPLSGLFVIKLYKGSYQQFFGEAGRLASFGLPLILLSLLGSFGVVPRCITVAYGSFHFIFPHLSLFAFSLFFCLLMFFFCLNDQFMVKALGKWMSPILLGSLILLIIIAVFKAPQLTGHVERTQALSHGFFTGYQTMDLFAAFFFSALIFQQIQQRLPEASPEELIRFAVKPSLLGAFLLAVIYLGLVYLGAHYAPVFAHVAPELMLPQIAEYAMGGSATFIMAIIMFFSCLTTAIALNNLYARYLCNLGGMRATYFPWVLSLTTLVSFIISLLNFQGIAAFLIPILQISYPAIIILTLLCLFSAQYNSLKSKLFYLAIFLTCIYTYARF